MRPATPPPSLPIFRSSLQATLLARLLLHPQRSYTAAQLVQAAQESRATVFRELRRLTGAGLVDTVVVGHATHYSAATHSPLYPALRELIRRTLGVEDMLRSGLRDMAGVDAAAIFGPWARGELGPTTGINVLVVGEPDPVAVDALANRAGVLAGRTVTPVIWSREELDQELGWRSGFIVDVVGDSMVTLVGDPLAPGG